MSSRLSISALYDSHNGTEISCADVSSITLESSSTTIIIIDSQIQGMHYTCTHVVVVVTS